MKIRHLLLTVALVSTAALAIWGDKTPANAVSDAVVKKGKNEQHVSQKTMQSQRQQDTEKEFIGRLISRNQLISNERQDHAHPLFGQQNWAPHVEPVKAIVVTPAPVIPTAPPLPFQFIGKKFEDGVYEIYLSQGDKTYAVGVNSTIEDLYRIDSIKPPVLTLTYLPLKQTQTLMIGSSN